MFKGKQSGEDQAAAIMIEQIDKICADDLMKKGFESNDDVDSVVPPLTKQEWQELGLQMISDNFNKFKNEKEDSQRNQEARRIDDCQIDSSKQNHEFKFFDEQ